MALASGVICGWPSTNATIPAGFTEKTAWANRYLRGAVAAGDAGGTGGSTTHTHAELAKHSHSESGTHYHTILAAQGSGIATGTTTGSPTVSSGGAHGHSGFASGFSSGGTGTAFLGVQTESNDLAYNIVLWIESDGTPAGLPASCIAFTDSDTLPDAWTRVYGNRYLKGASSGGDGGGTGGSNVHDHDTSHGHVGKSHAHSTVTSTVPTEPFGMSIDHGAGFNRLGATGHTHQVGVSTGGDSINTPVVTFPTGSHEPVYEKINCIQNDSGNPQIPDGIIAIWGSTNGSIPANWARVTAYDADFIKHCNADTEVGDTGGATQHNHTGITCAVTSAGHDHSDSTSTSAPSARNSGPASGSTWAAGNHGHNGNWNVLSNNNPTYNNATGISVALNSSESAYPEWVRAILIEYTTPAVESPHLRTLTGMGM